MSKPPAAPEPGVWLYCDYPTQTLAHAVRQVLLKKREKIGVRPRGEGGTVGRPIGMKLKASLD